MCIRDSYHPDHLGSSSYITNLDGEVVQHIEYVPFGEVFIEAVSYTHLDVYKRQFLASSNKLLEKVTVNFQGETLRSYAFDYKDCLLYTST